MSGDTVKMNVGGNLNIQSLQDKDNYSEHDSSEGISLSGTSSKNKSISASANETNIDSNYQSTTNQAGIYAGNGGFDINVNNNTNLTGAVIASDVSADKNKLSTGTLTYSDIQNKASYDANSTGVSYNDGSNVKKKDKGVTPNIGVEATGSSSGTTKSAIAAGTIDIRNNPNHNISGLSRDTQDALNKLGKIFDKDKVEEKQELASVFGQDVFDAIGDIKQLKDGSPEKIAVTAFAGGLMSKPGGGDFVSGAAGAGINQLVINELAKIKDPAVMQWASAVIGAAASKAAGGSAATGASTASSDTKNNDLTHDQQLKFKEELSEVYSIGGDPSNTFARYAAISEYREQHGLSDGDEIIEGDLYPLISCAVSDPDWLNGGMNYTLDKIVNTDPNMYSKANEYRSQLEQEHSSTTSNSGGDDTDEFDLEKSVEKNAVTEGVVDLATLPATIGGDIAEKGVVKTVLRTVGAPVQFAWGIWGDWKDYSGDDCENAMKADFGGFVVSGLSDVAIGGSGGTSFVASAAADVLTSTAVDKYKKENLKTDAQKKAESGE